MRSFALILILSVALVGQFACRAKTAANNSTANANTETVSPFAQITDAPAALAEGDRLLDDNQTELSIEAFKRAVEIDPDLGEAYFKMGIAYALLESEAQKNGGAEHLPGDVTANNKPIKTNSVKMFEKAVEVYKRQLNGSSKDAGSYFNLGRAYNKLDKDEQAEDALAQAVKLSPEDSEYQTELGAIRVKLAKYHEAISALKKAIDLDADNVEAADLLEDAEAGAKRVDYVSPKSDSNKTVSNANTNANVASDSNSTSTPANNNKPPANKKPVDPDARERIVKDPKVVKTPDKSRPHKP